MSYIFEDPSGTGGYAPVTKDQISGALGQSGLDQSSQTSVYNQLFPKVSAPSSGGGNNGGSAPIDWRSLVQSDPYYRQQLADMNAQSLADAATRAASIRKALAQWGMVPDFTAAATRLGLSPDALKYLNSDVNDETRALADKNTKEGLSIFARLQKQHMDNLRNLKRALAARGLAASGETGYGIGEENLQYKQATTDNEQKLLDYITGAVAAFQQAEQQRQRDKANYLQEAAGRVFDQYGGSMGGGGSGGSSSGGGSNLVEVTGENANNLAKQGVDVGQVGSAADAYAKQRGWPVRPGGYEVMHNGAVEDYNGKKVVWVKFMDSQGRSTTEPVEVSPGGGGSSSSSSTASSAPVSGQTSESNPFGLFLG